MFNQEFLDRHGIIVLHKAGEERRTYREVLSWARSLCPTGYHVMIPSDYMRIWSQEVETIRCCRVEAYAADQATPTNTPNPFPLPVILDTWLTGWKKDGAGNLRATVMVHGREQGESTIPHLGKIYRINTHGLPEETGGAKTLSSEAYIHTWWAFSTHQVCDMSGNLRVNFDMALFGNGGIMGCFYELLKAHYSLDDFGGVYHVLAVRD